MTKFFDALERAEQDQALRRHTAPLEPAAGHGRAAPETVPDRVPQASVERPAGVSDGLEEHLVSLLAPTSFEAEQYRTLRHLIEQLHKAAELQVFAVSSPTASDGKTTTAINLAGALAQSHDARVLLIDADLRVPTVGTNLGLDERPGPGLADTLCEVRATGAGACPCTHRTPYMQPGTIWRGSRERSATSFVIRRNH